MADFRTFDQRGYPTVDVTTGYGDWVATYEDTVEDTMDLALLDRLVSVPWSGASRAADLACGTGRTGAWLKAHGVRRLDGVDLTPAMLDRARQREGLYDRLVEGDVTHPHLNAAGYDVVTACLVDEHLPSLTPLYTEAGRIAKPGGHVVVVGIHPHFQMAAGMPTHYRRPDDDAPQAITTYVHQLSDHVEAAHAAGLELAELRERLIDDAFLTVKPKWVQYAGRPVSFAWAWRKP